jgi:hypothetical protein
MPGSPSSTAKTAPSTLSSSAAISEASSPSRPTSEPVAATSGLTSAAGPGGDAPGLERGILPQHGQLEVAQRLARLDPQLVDEGPPGLGERRERLRLLAAAVTGQGQAAPPRLVQRPDADRLLELAEHRRVPAQLQVGLEPAGPHALAPLVEPGREAFGEPAPRQPGEHRAPPEVLGREQEAVSVVWTGRLQGLLAPVRELLEAAPVEGLGGQGQAVARPPPFEHRAGRSEGAAQPRDVAVHRGGRVRGRVVPQRLHQRVRADDPAGGDRQGGDQRLGQRTSELRVDVVDVDAQLTQDVHADSGLAAGRHDLQGRASGRCAAIEEEPPGAVGLRDGCKAAARDGRHGRPQLAPFRRPDLESP